MAWNGSDKERVEVEGSSTSTSTPRFSYKALVAGLVVVIGGGLAAWLFMGGEKGEGAESVVARPSQIAEVKPAVVTNEAKEAEPPKPVKPDPNARPEKVGEILNGYIKLPSGRLHRIKGEYTNTVATTARRPSYAIFDHDCDNEIACYLTLEPGKGLVGTPRYNGRFTKEFLKSLESPLIPPEGASEEDRELYKAVRDAKIEMKAAYDRGEDIEKIMLDTRKELQDMASYRLALEQDVRKMIREEAQSGEDIDDLIGAANKMLESKGIAPMTFGPIAKKRFEMFVNETKKGQ